MTNRSADPNLEPQNLVDLKELDLPMFCCPVQSELSGINPIAMKVPKSDVRLGSGLGSIELDVSFLHPWSPTWPFRSSWSGCWPHMAAEGV